MPGRAVSISQWTRSELFEVRGYRRGKRQVVVRVFNPGTVTIRGNGIRYKRRDVSRGTHRVKVTWKKNRKASQIKVRFKPLNAYPETRSIRARR